jgi:hypothetical protein
MSMELSTDRNTVEIASPTGERGMSTRLRAELSELRWTVPCLLLTLVYIGLGHAVASAYGLPVHWPVGYLFGQAKKIALVVYLVLLSGFFADTLLGPRVRARYLRELLFSPRFVAELLLVIAAVNGTVMMFVNLKQFVPALNPALYDSPLWRLDAWLHFGLEPAAFVSDWAGENGWMDFLDQAYVLFFPAQLVVPLLFLVSRRLRPERARFFFALCLLWMAGGLVYVLWPSLGPVYYRPSRFFWLEEAPYARHLQLTLLQDYVRFRGDPAYYALKLSHGVAALPSMHIGVLAFFAIATHRLRLASLVLWLLTAITFVGSLALAWHYAIDGYAGVLLAAIAWWVGGLVARRREGGASALREEEGEGARVAC